jgi:hypothetical protein
MEMVLQNVVRVEEVWVEHTESKGNKGTFLVL